MIVLACVTLAIGSMWFLAVGLISLFDKDRAWTLSHVLYRLRGVETVRTDTWDMLENVRGIAAIAAGLIMAWFVWQVVSIALQR